MLTSTHQAILYDLSHKGPNPNTCWSPNVWKTRLILNYKKIPYTTIFIPHGNIQPTLSALEILPNDPPASAYTVPTMKLPDGTYMMDSANLAPALEKQFPEPSLHLETGLHEEAQKALGRVAFPLLKILFPAIARNIIIESYVPQWIEKKEKALGVSMQEFEASGGENAWKAAEPGFAALKEFMAANKKDQGPFLLGSRVSYGDFLIVALLEASRRIGDGIFERAVSYDDQLKELHAACGEWFVDDK